MTIDQTAVFTFLGIVVMAVVQIYLAVRTKQVHSLVNANYSKQASLIAQAKEEARNVATMHAQKIESLHMLIAELNRKIPAGVVAVPSEPQPAGTESDPLQVEVVDQAKPLDVVVKK